jgi:hypothetical protein
MLRPRIPGTPGQLRGNEPITSYLVKRFFHSGASYGRWESPRQSLAKRRPGG